MSYLDEYYKYKKKKDEGKTSNNGSYLDEYNKLLVSEEERKAAEGRSLLNSAVANALAYSGKQSAGENTWFQSGAFDDGYQFGDVTKTIVGTLQDVNENITTAVFDATENLIDTTAYGVGMIGGLFDKGFKDDVGNFIAKEILTPKQSGEAVATYANPIGWANLLVNGGKTEENSVLGDTADGLVQSASHEVGSWALQMVGVPVWLTRGVNAFGSEIESAFQNDATYTEAAISGGISAAAEIMFGKLSGAIKFEGAGIFDDGLQHLLKTGIKNKLVRTIAKYVTDVGLEGTEEVLTEIASGVGRKMTYLDDKEWNEILSSENLFDAFIGGAVMSGVHGGVQIGKSVKTGRDYTTGLTANEEKVVNKLYEEEVAKQEQGGKLTYNEKIKIYDDIVDRMRKGDIDTDTIESVLGGESYKSYTSMLEQETALKNEQEALENTPESQFTVKQRERLTEVRKQLSGIDTKTAKSNLFAEVDKLTQKDTFLRESYNEKARRGQAFEADLTKYDAKQQATIQKAIDSGILNNTRRTHEFVDMIAKISADKGVLFDFTNNQKLKESGFAINGKQVNGYVTKDGVTLNLNSSKALDTVVGHEITHILKGTELYNELQNAITEYAKSKGDYQGRLDTLTKLYENIKDADVNKELVADLVGDYLFTDADFINNLSTNHRNVFQKIYDEIKYLCKLATAGSEEARELEKVKKLFAEAYRATTEIDEHNDADTKYSIREAEPPKETGVAYKVFFVKDGKLYPPMVANPDGADTPIGVWLDADVGQAAPPSKTGRQQVKAGGKGTQGGGGSLAFRPGWHLGDLPRASQFDRVNPETGKKELFPENFVWAEVEYAKDVDYQEEAMSYGYTENGKFRHAYAGLPRLPENGYYRYRTNPKPDTVPWIITGSMKVNRLLSDAEVNQILEKNGVAPVHRQGGDVELDKFGINENVKYSVSDSDGNTLSKEQQEYFKDSKIRDENGNLQVVYHGTPNGDYSVFKEGTYFTTNKAYADRYQNAGASSISAGKTATSPKTFEVYLDIKKPFDLNDAEAKRIYIEEYIKGGNALGINPYLSDAEYEKIDTIDWTEGEDLRDFLIENGYDYDGLVLDEGADGGYGEDVQYRGKSYVIFNPEQAKSVDNTNPTKNPDMRFSLSDSNGKTLYTGSPVTDIQQFKVGGVDGAKQTGDRYGRGVYLTTNKTTAQGYAGDSGRVYEINADALNIFNLNDSITEEMKATLHRELNGKDKQFRNSVLRNFRSEKTFTDFKSAEIFFDEQRKIWKEEDGYYSANKPEILSADDKTGKAVIEYTDFVNIDNAIGNLDGNQLYDALKSISTDDFASFITGHGFDGIAFDEDSNNQQYVIYRNEDRLNILPESKADPDARFSLSEPVEETKNLVALHNLTADKLTKSLELGGLPMPSLAITKADIPHSNFGEITLVFGKETIDPKASKKNKVYSADAWTPTFPNVEYEADSKVVSRVSQKLRELGGLVDEGFQRDLSRIGYSIEDYLNRQGGEEGLVQYVMDNDGLKAAYLEDIGKHIEPVTKQEEVPRNFNLNLADRYTQVMDILDVTTAEEVMAVNLKEARDNHGAELEAVFPGITQSGLRMGKVLGSVASYLKGKDSPVEYKTVIDSEATRKAVDDAVDTEGFEAWTRNLFSGVEKDSGIYNNKDLFTPSGNRRTFKQTHLPVTLENIVKAMASQNDGNSKNVSGFNGVKTLRAATAESFKSIDEMHKREGRLQHLTQEQADEITDALHSRLSNIINAIDNENEQKGDRNPYIRYDQIGDALSEIGEGGKYNVADIQSVFSEYGRTVSDDTALEVKQLLYDVTQMPVNIFEAKPQRVVNFDEAKVFVIPRNADVKLKQELLNRGYSIAEYDPDVEGDRQKVVNQFEEYQFSLSEQGEDIAPVGKFFGKDMALEGVPVAENAKTENVPNAENIAPVMEEADSLEAQLYRAEQTLEALDKETESLFRDYAEQKISDKDFETKWRELDKRYAPVRQEQERLNKEITEDENQRFASLDDADVPPEMEAPYYGEAESVEPIDPFAERDMNDVGKKNVKAYMHENPEVKPYFQQAAREMLGELQNGVKGERIFNDDVYYESGGEKGWMGTKRHTTEDIASLLDDWGYTYDQIEAGLNAIIEDNGKENNAVSKRIEFMLDNRLRNGYTGLFGEVMPRDDGYVNLLKEMQLDNSRREAFDSFMETADKYAPPEDFAPMKDEPVFEGKQNTLDGFEQAEDKPERTTRAKLYSEIIGGIKSELTSKGYDFDKVLDNARRMNALSINDNTPQRVNDKTFGYEAGEVLNDLTFNKGALNETEKVKWLNKQVKTFRNLSKKYGIKPFSKEDGAAQMYAEGFYVNEKNEIISYGDAELAKDFPDVNVQNRIKAFSKDPANRKFYDESLALANESRRRNGYPEIPRLDNYYLHFRAMDDTFSKLGIPFNPNDIKAKDLPTDINGMTVDRKPGQPFFTSAMHREGKRTSFGLLGGMEKYANSVANQIYHIDDIQTIRALWAYIAEKYGQAHGLENLDSMELEAQAEHIQKVYDGHLSNYARFLNEYANNLAGKTALIDRGIEGLLGRRALQTINTINSQVGKNQVGFNVSSAGTNFIPLMEVTARLPKQDVVKAFAQTVSNKFRKDGFAENNPTLIRRKGADKFSKTPWEKVTDTGYVLMSAVDNLTSEIIVRSKYNELTRKGMDSKQAHIRAGEWAMRVMGDRSYGQMPMVYNSKVMGLVTKYQLEVRNALDSMFYDTFQEAKASTKDIENQKARNAATAAKYAFKVGEIAVLNHLFGTAFEKIAGYNPAFDIVSTIMTLFGLDDEDEEDTFAENAEQAFQELLGDLPYANVFTGGGRIPVSSALPIEQFVSGKDEYGNEKSRWETIGETLPYYLLPGGYGQIKKTYQGLKMFDDDLPVYGSYTDKGNLRFPVEKTPWNVVQAGLFGQYASENARDYFDNERSPLKEKQIQEFIDVDIPIRDYWDYREGLAKQETLEDKFDYIADLDLPVAKKNILINNIVDRNDPVDMENYDDFSSLDEFDFAAKNPGKYAVSQVVGDYNTYTGYKDVINGFTADKDESGKSISGSKKAKVVAYIDNLPLDYGQKCILFRSFGYKTTDADNRAIVEYLDSREDITYEEMVTILTELDFTVNGNNVYWD
jgi:hypothetical protein